MRSRIPAKPTPVSALVSRSRSRRRYAASIILYFQSYLLKLLLEADPNLRSSRVAMYVRQAFLQDAEEGNLCPYWESLLNGCDICLYVDPGALGETLDVPLSCASKADFIQQGWVQQVRHGANFLDGLIRQMCHIREELRYGWVFPAVFLKKRNTDFQRCQRLAGAVVQVPRQLASFFILHLHKPLRQVLQLGGALQNHRLHLRMLKCHLFGISRKGPHTSSWKGQEKTP